MEVKGSVVMASWLLFTLWHFVYFVTFFGSYNNDFSQRSFSFNTFKLFKEIETLKITFAEYNGCWKVSILFTKLDKSRNFSKFTTPWNQNQQQRRQCNDYTMTTMKTTTTLATNTTKEKTANLRTEGLISFLDSYQIFGEKSQVGNGRWRTNFQTFSIVSVVHAHIEQRQQLLVVLKATGRYLFPCGFEPGYLRKN